MRKPKNSNVRKDIQVAIKRLEQVVEDAKRRGDTDYFTKENEHGETQSDIDNFFLSELKKNPNGFGGKCTIWK